jgi:mediator of RNA polymerase II transcription subunit 7
MSGEDLISSLYPPPPPYVKFFTNENLNRLEQWKAQNNPHESSTVEPSKNGTNTGEGDDDDIGSTSKDEDSNSLVPPGELRFLVPPSPPQGTHYRGYGSVWSFEDKLPSLKESNWQQLYSDDDESITSDTKIHELHKLMDSLLLNFLELIGIASVDPSKFAPKIKNISLILININHLLNTYRPHQSRESLIMLLKRKIESKKLEMEKIDKVSNEIKAKIKTLATMNDLNYNPTSQNEHRTSSDPMKDDIVGNLLQQL